MSLTTTSASVDRRHVEKLTSDAVRLMSVGIDVTPDVGLRMWVDKKVSLTDRRSGMTALSYTLLFCLVRSIDVCPQASACLRD